MGWLNTLVDEAKFAHDINYLGPAYVLAELAAKQLESEGKTEEAREIRATMLDSTIDAAMMAGLGKGLWGAGKALFRKLLAPIIRLGAGMAGGIGGMYAGDKLVHTLSDGKYDTWGDMIQDKTKGIVTPTLAYLSNPLAILGGFAGGWGANKAYTGTKRGKLDVLSGALDGLIENTKLGPSFIDQAAFLGKFGWAPKQKIRYRHGSKLADLKTFVPKHDRWDVVTHGADPNMYFVTDQSTPVSAANMMDRRAYQYTGNIMAEKPMVQIGEIKPAGVKNNSRNQLIARARQQGADTYIMQGIEDNQVPNLNIVARFIGPEGEAVQGGTASIKWYGPTMGKTTAAKVSDKLVDIDPLLKPIRAKHAERLGLKISDPKVSADPAYKQEVADFVLEWRANPENQDKTLVASTKHLLDPQYKVEFANEPSIPDFETFAARNKARGFKETDEQLRAWYNSILGLGRDLNIDNRFVLDVEGLAPTSHLQGDDAVRMFNLYAEGYKLPATETENVRLLRAYVAEARERYGLVGNDKVSDETILKALYKHVDELGGNTAARNMDGEPQLLFRGDTKRYTELKPRVSPEELVTMSGTMDNSLGTLFLGELPGTGVKGQGLERYLVHGREFNGNKRLIGSGTGAHVVSQSGDRISEFDAVASFPQGSRHLVTHTTSRGIPHSYYKLPPTYSSTGVNDINGFVVRTPNMRNASKEISVLNDDFLVQASPDKVSYYGPKRRVLLDKDGFPLLVDESGNVVGDALAGSSERSAMAQHYRHVLDDAKLHNQGLLKSEGGSTNGIPGNYLRDEHTHFNYFALPNFNIQNAKHILPYDFRIPRNWLDPNIFKIVVPTALTLGEAGTAAYNIYDNQPLYQKQGGILNYLNFFK